MKLKGLEVADLGGDYNIRRANTSETERIYNFQIQRGKHCCKQRHTFLLNRVATAWNNLTVDTVNAPSLNTFKW
jgi:hypothetical protein